MTCDCSIPITYTYQLHFLLFVWRDFLSDYELKGKAKQVKGRVRNTAGKLTGNTRQRAKGSMEHAGGKIQEAAGRATRRRTRRM